MLSFLALSALPLLIFGYMGLSDLQSMGNYAVHTTFELGESAISDSTRALKDLGKAIIKEKAEDVARQMEIYVSAHPQLNQEELRQDEVLARIAVQPVGKTGYTSVLDSNGINVFHYNQKLIGVDLNELKNTLPDFYVLLQNMKSPRAGDGYYKWKDADGAIRDKYLYHVPVEGTNLRIAATTYIDEFLEPIKETKQKIAQTTADTTGKISTYIRKDKIIFLGGSLVMAAVVCVISLMLSRRITTPILRLVSETEAIGSGKLDSKIDIYTGDEIEKLAVSFKRMSVRLKEHIRRLQETTAVKERLQRELEIAKGIQQNFLPTVMPMIGRIDVAAFSLPAREVGGDFYDFIPINKDKWAIEIGDVSGKGIPAAIFMALSQTLIRSIDPANLTSSQIIKQVNKIIASEAKSGMFVTLFYAIVDTEKMTLGYSNAGHNPPLVMRKEPSDIVLLKAHGFPVGVFKDIELHDDKIKISPGDVIVFYTDGITEAINTKREQFGEGRLTGLIRENQHLSAQEVVKKVLEAMEVFTGKEPQFDDITLIVLKIV